MTTSRLNAVHNPWIQVETPLGSLGMAGVIVDSQGTGRSFRTFGLHALVLLLGNGRYQDATGADIRLRPGDCIRVQPHLPHRYGPEPGDMWSEAYVAFSGPSFDAWYNPPRAPVQPLGNAEGWLPRWLALIGQYPHNPREAVRLLAEIHLLFNDLEQPEDSHQAQFARRLDRSRRQLEAWPAETAPDWERLAAACHCSYETWRKAFRETFGEPPARYRRRLLMERAAELLRRTPLSNEQIAAQFGCSDAFHFSKLFKSVHGHSPSAARKKALVPPPDFGHIPAPQFPEFPDTPA
jgi:AraC-like DNA-binding protein